MDEFLCIHEPPGGGSVAFSPDGTLVVSSSQNLAYLWELKTARVVHRFVGHTAHINCVTFAADGRTLASSSGLRNPNHGDCTIRLWDVETGAELRRFEGHEDAILSVAFSHDGSQLVSGSFDQSVRLWEANTGQAIRKLSGHTGGVNAVAFSPDDLVLSGGSDNTIRLWEAGTGQQIRQILCRDWIHCAAFSPNGKYIISGSGHVASDESIECVLRLWDAASGQEVRQFVGHEGDVNCVVFTPDGSRIISGSGGYDHVWGEFDDPAYDPSVRLWDVRTGSELACFDGHEGPVTGLAVSPDGNCVVSSSTDGTIRVIRLPSRA